MSVHFRVAELAGLYGLNSDTLRYYEEQGLLHPRRDANGYRAYSIADLCNLNIIRSLRELGVAVPQIRQYLQNRTVAGTEKMLTGQQEIIEEKIRELNQALEDVELRRNRLRAAMARPVGRTELLELPERPCVLQREPGIPEADVDYLLKRLEQRHRGVLKDLGSRQMGAVMDHEALASGHCDCYEAVFFLCDAGKERSGSLPAGRYLSLIHAGGYGNLAESYRALYAAAEARSLRAVDVPVELYLVDIHDTGDEAEFRTELQIRVEEEKRR